MDYLGWELERQRAALWALLLGGGTEDGENSGEEHTVREGEAPPGGARRSPAGPGAARGSAVSRDAGRYAENGGAQPRNFPRDFPGAWEAVREAEGSRPGGESGALRATASAGEGSLLGSETAAPDQGGGDAETGVPRASRREARQGAQGPAREGTGPRAALWEPSGEGSPESWETAAERTAEAAAGVAGGRSAGQRSAGKGPSGSADLPPEGTSGGGTAGEASAAARRDGAGTVRFGGGGFGGALGQGEPLSRSLPWGGGWESPSLRAEDGARALSRAVQRDARRYDGGFAIY